MNILNESRRADMTNYIPHLTAFPFTSGWNPFNSGSRQSRRHYAGLECWIRIMNDPPHMKPPPGFTVTLAPSTPNYRELVEQFMRERFCVTDPPFHDTLELSNYRIALYTFADWLQKHAETFT